MNDRPILELARLTQHFAGARRKTVRAVQDVSLTVARGETIGVVGESGSGKTTVGRSALRLYKPTGGRIVFDGTDITAAGHRTLATVLRRNSAMVFQNPSTSLNPYLRIEDALIEGLAAHGIDTKAGRRRRAREMLDRVGLESRLAARYPHELSGGQRQRVGIARALVGDPALVVADEPTASLDVSVQAQVVNLLADLQRERGLGYLFISHDLDLVRYLSDRIVVMYLGRIVESGTAEAVFSAPAHPYTVSLASMRLPQADRIVPGGDPPSPTAPPSGCAFHPRCPLAQDVCARAVPELTDDGNGRRIACHFAGKLALPSSTSARPSPVPPLRALTDTDHRRRPED